MRARNDTDMRDAQGLRVRGFRSQAAKGKGAEKGAEPLDEIMQQEVRGVEEQRGTCRECGECVNFPILALLSLSLSLPKCVVPRPESQEPQSRR